MGPSAAQLLLETDPAAREPRSTYEAHYAALALGQLHAALEQQQLLQARLGAGEAGELLARDKLGVLVADCLLARDRMSALVADVRRRQAANEVPPCEE